MAVLHPALVKLVSRIAMFTATVIHLHVRAPVSLRKGSYWALADEPLPAGATWSHFSLRWEARQALLIGQGADSLVKQLGKMAGWRF